MTVTCPRCKRQQVTGATGRCWACGKPLDSTDNLRRTLLDIMRRMDCQDLFDDAFHALIQYEHALTDNR